MRHAEPGSDWLEVDRVFRRVGSFIPGKQGLLGDQRYRMKNGTGGEQRLMSWPLEARRASSCGSALASILLDFPLKTSLRGLKPTRARVGLCCLFAFAFGLGFQPVEAAVIEVNGPGESIQAAIDLANDGDVILIAPGTYVEPLIIEHNFITLASCFFTTGDPSCIENTIIEGVGRFNTDPNIVRIKSAAPDGSRFIGLTFQNGADGIHASAHFEFRNSVVRLCGDGLDYDGGSGGLVIDSVIEDNFEDGIDIDGVVDVTIQDSVIRRNWDEGIEIRIDDQPNFPNSIFVIAIRGNTITENFQDGIQLINSDTLTPREIIIDRNIIANNLKSGVGMMCCGNTLEDFQGAVFDESVTVTNNTFYQNDHGLTGGGNLVVLNNIFLESTNIGLKNATAGAVVAHNLFFGNGVNWLNSDVDLPTTLVSDPLVDSAFELSISSPAIDFGTAHFESGGMVLLDIPIEMYFGSAPDLGARENMLEVPAVPVLSRHAILALVLALMAGLDFFQSRRLANR